MTIEKASKLLGGVGARREPVRSTDWLGRSWQHLDGAVWEHISGMRIHCYGLARMPDGTIKWFMHDWRTQYFAMRLVGFNRRRAIMAWALSLLRPNHVI